MTTAQLRQAASFVIEGRHSAIDGVPTRYWRYPASGGKPHDATVERFDDHIGLGMTSDPPPALSLGRGNT